MSTNLTKGIRLGIPEIAEIADVTPSAVTNWRKRHKDFPAAVTASRTGTQFDADEVERWLIMNGKINRRITSNHLLWPFLDALRANLDPHELATVLSAVIVLAEIRERVREGGDIDLDVDDDWVSFDRPADDFGAWLHDTAVHLEASNLQLEGMLLPGIRAGVQRLTPEELLHLVRLVVGATSEGDGDLGTGQLFDDLRRYLFDVDRFSEEYATPTDLQLLFALLAAESDAVFDPACGEGGSLVLTARRGAFLVPPRPHRMVGWELNADVFDVARTRAFVNHAPIDFTNCNSLTTTPLPESIDTVILDAPMGIRDWGTADDYVSERWTYGSPPPSSADMAWLQIALATLADNGRAYVLLAPGSLSKSGAQERIRRAMLDAGVIDSIVQLPSRLRRNTSIPVVMWCLRPKHSVATNDVLFVDASDLGTAGRSTVTLEPGEVTSLADILQRRRRGEPVAADDPRIELIVVAGGDVDSGNLHPDRYKPIKIVDRAELHRDREAALTAVVAARAEADRAITDLLTSLEGRS